MDFRAYEAAPGISVIVLPDAPLFTHVAVSNDFVRYAGMKREEVIGKGHFEVFPKSPDDPNFTGEQNIKASFEYIIRNKVPHQIPFQRYDIPVGDGSFRQKYWQISNAPILDDFGEVAYIVHTALDITDRVVAEQKVAASKGIEQAYKYFMSAPVIIGIIRGEQYIIELANENLLEVWGRTADVVGKPLLEAIPELEAQGFKLLLDQVCNTGEPFYAYEYPITLKRNGKDEVLYFDFVYKPFYEDGKQGRASGIISVGHEVTDQVRTRQKFKNLVEQATDPILILKGEDMVLEVANEALFKLWKVDESALGKPFLEILPEMKEQGFFDLLQEVYHTGKPFQGFEVPAVFEEEEGARTVFFNFTYQPYREADGSITGVLVLAADVTGQVMAKKLVAENREELKRFKFMADNAQDPFILMREDGSFAYLNKKALEAWGYSGEEAKDIRVPDVDPTYNDAVFAETFAKAHSQEVPRFETLYKRKDGHVYPVEINMGGLMLDGKPHLFAVARDITERKGLEEARRKSEENLRSMILQSPVAMCILKGASFVVEIANESMLQLCGKNAGQMMDKPLFEGLPEAKEQGLEQLLQNVYLSGKRFTANEMPVVLPRNGKLQTAYLNFAYEPFVDADGTVAGVMAVAIDLTDQVLSRMKVEESHRELQFVMDVMPQMVWHTQPDGAADFFNKVYLDYTGLSLEQLVGHKWTALIHPDDMEASVNTWQQAFSGNGSGYAIEHRLRGKDGAYRWFLTRGVPLKDRSGKVVKWYGTTTDIQEQKTNAQMLEQRVQERTTELEMRNREMEQFAYVSHHDLQEPLRKITMFTDMTKQEAATKLSEGALLKLEKVGDAARRMSTALRDVLNFAALSKEEHASRIDLNEVLAAVLTDLELVIAEKQAVINVDPLPVIKGIPQQMSQLLYNLLNNALKFSKQGITPVIEVTCKLLTADAIAAHRELDPQKRYYKIVVQDNGIGFNPQYAGKIFDMFQRLHSKSDYVGTGIGLALVKKIIENHAGKVWAESRAGEGATFNVLLPEA